MPAGIGGGEQAQRGVPNQTSEHRGNRPEATGSKERTREGGQADNGNVQEDGEAKAGAAAGRKGPIAQTEAARRPCRSGKHC